MRRLLSECNLVTVTAPSGLHALQVLQERRVDAVVADQVMPGMDGVHLLGIVRERWPDTERVFTYWDYRAGMFHQDLGMRIDLILAGGFPPFLLQPINFEQLYRDQRRGAVADHPPHLRLGQRRRAVLHEQRVHRVRKIAARIDQRTVQVKSNQTELIKSQG
jgi:response regulator RpfG family c-di-GMP phosphodiesterase